MRPDLPAMIVDENSGMHIENTYFKNTITREGVNAPKSNYIIFYSDIRATIKSIADVIRENRHINALTAQQGTKHEIHSNGI